MYQGQPTQNQHLRVTNQVGQNFQSIQEQTRGSINLNNMNQTSRQQKMLHVNKSTSKRGGGAQGGNVPQELQYKLQLPEIM